MQQHLKMKQKTNLADDNFSGGLGVNYFDFKAIKSLKAFIKENDIAIVHAHATSFFIVFLTKLIYPKFKMVWHDHYGNSEFLEKRKSFIIKVASYWMNGIIAVNQQLKEWAEKELAVSKVTYLSNFPVKNISVAKTTILEGVEGKRIICLANLRPQKDHFNLLLAFEMVAKPDWTLHLVGKDFEDDYVEQKFFQQLFTQPEDRHKYPLRNGTDNVKFL